MLLLAISGKSAEKGEGPDKEISGINVRALSIEGLVKTKESSLRGQDKHDVQFLRRAMIDD